MTNLFNQLNPLSQRLPSNVMDMIRTFKGMSNPQQMINQMMEQNPQIKSLIQAANGNPEKAFRDMAKKMNIDPDEFINMLKQFTCASENK